MNCIGKRKQINLIQQKKKIMARSSRINIREFDKLFQLSSRPDHFCAVIPHNTTISQSYDDIHLNIEFLNVQLSPFDESRTPSLFLPFFHLVSVEQEIWWAGCSDFSTRVSGKQQCHLLQSKTPIHSDFQTKNRVKAK